MPPLAIARVASGLLRHCTKPEENPSHGNGIASQQQRWTFWIRWRFDSCSCDRKMQILKLTGKLYNFIFVLFKRTWGCPGLKVVSSWEGASFGPHIITYEDKKDSLDLNVARFYCIGWSDLQPAMVLSPKKKTPRRFICIRFVSSFCCPAFWLQKGMM